MKFLLIKAMAEDHAYSAFVSALRRAFTELGHASNICDVSALVVGGSAPTQPLVAELQTGSYDAVLSFSSFFGSVTLQNGQSLFDAFGVKFVGWQLDHPIYAPQSLSRALQNRYAIYSNINHQRFAKAVKLPGKSLTMLPGGAAVADLPEHSARQWPIFVAATWNGRPERTWEALPDSAGKRLMIGVVDRLLKDRKASVLDAFNDTSAKLKLGARLGDDPAFDEQMRNFLCTPLNYLRHLDRIGVIQALVDADLPVTICGAGWEDVFGARANVTYVAPVPFETLPSLYANARVVLNLNAGNGGCERAIHAALAGAAVVSDYSRQLDELFGRQGIAFFNRARPKTAAEVVAGLADTSALARHGYDRAVASSLWVHRAQQIVDFVSA